MSKFQVPPSKAGYEQNRFTFEINGKTFDIPKLQFIKPALMKRISGRDAEALVIGLIDEYYPAIPAQPAVEAVDATDTTPAVPARPAVPRRPAATEEFESLDQLLALYEAWAEASGINLGESSGSSNSSTSTGEPSTETSTSPGVPSAEETTTETSAPNA